MQRRAGADQGRQVGLRVLAAVLRVRVNGAGWTEETHPFTSPSYGIAGPDSIAYPFNLECGTAQQYQSYVEAWIYDTEGVRSQPVVIHLVCAS